MNPLAQAFAEDLRLRVLEILEQAPAREANSLILREALEHVGHRTAMDRLRTELAWLEEQGCVALSTVGSILVASLTARGIDVALGRARVPGVRAPDPT